MTARIKVLITIRRHQNMLTGPPGRVCPSVTSVDSGVESTRRRKKGGWKRCRGGRKIGADRETSIRNERGRREEGRGEGTR